MERLLTFASGALLLAACGGKVVDSNRVAGGSDVGSGSSGGGAGSRSSGSGGGPSSGGASSSSGGGVVGGTGSNSGITPGGSGAASSGGIGVSDATAPTGTTCTPVARPTACSQNPTGSVVTQTLDAFRAAISHRWLLCGNQSVFGPNGGGGDNGLEITVDGHWYKLFAAVGGGTVRGASLDQEGTWTAIRLGSQNDPQPFQLNLFLGSGTVVTRPVLASTPPAMRLNNNGVFVGNYVLDQSVPVGSVRCWP